MDPQDHRVLLDQWVPQEQLAQVDKRDGKENLVAKVCPVVSATQPIGLICLPMLLWEIVGMSGSHSNHSISHQELWEMDKPSELRPGHTL